MTDIEQIILTSIDLAKRFKHDYLTIEHLTAVVLDDPQIRTMCYEIAADHEGLQSALIEFLENQCGELISDPIEESAPRKTQMLERVFNRALTQALFQGKKSINQLDLVLSILSEEKSTSVMFSDQMGLTKTKIVNWMADLDAGYEQYSSAEEDYYNQQNANLNATYGSYAQIPGPTKKKKSDVNHMEVIEQFCINLNQVSPEFDDVIGRRQELIDLVQTLARKKKSNVILAGPSGVGKTAIVQGLAKMIVEGEVPEIISTSTVWELDMGKLVAGTKYRGDFEERMKQLSEALLQVNDIVLFIDEIHTMIGAGSSNGSMDAGNMLKPSLSSGKLRVIGATTDEEYRKIFEKESALARRFTKIAVVEPSAEEAKEILCNTLDSYMDFHDVDIDLAAAEMAVDLSVQYIFNKQLPDKAFDIIDRACAANRILPYEDRVQRITTDSIREEVSKLVGVPVEHMGVKSEKEIQTKHVDVKEYLESTVFGQPDAINSVVDAITVSLAGLKDPNKPTASYLFTGPTGVGKTELAKRLSTTMNMKLCRYDMAEYQESHTVSKLIGSPPGYVGHGDGKAGDGLLITQLEDNPNCVLLLDEVEKAHPDLMSVLLSLLDEGTITSSSGKVVSAKNAIIIMTSNLGARDATIKSIGFNEETFNSKAIDSAINNFFAPEFRNRLDGIIRFNGLKEENMKSIVTKFLKEVETYVSDRNIILKWAPTTIGMLEKEGFDPAMGARPLSRLINQKIKLPLAKHMLANPTQNTIDVDYKDGKIVIA